MKKTNSYMAFLLMFLLIGLPAMAQEAEEEAEPIQEEGEQAVEEEAVVEEAEEAIEEEAVIEEAVEEEAIEEEAVIEEAIEEETVIEEAIEEEAVIEEAEVVEEAVLEEEFEDLEFEEESGGIKIGVGAGFTVYTGEYMADATSAPSIDIFVRIPYTLYLGPLNVSVGAELQTYSFTEGGGADISGIGLMGVANFDITETPYGAVYAHVGAGLLGKSLGITAGAKFDYPIPNVMEGKLSATAFLKANATLDGGLETQGDMTASTGWANFGIALNYAL